MNADALGLAYAQMFSMGSLGNLFAQPAQGNAEPSAAPVKAATKRAAKNEQ